MLLLEIERLKPHSLACSLIPEMSEMEFLLLKEDIKQNGILTPVEVIQQEKHEEENDYLIIDGIHRYKAAVELKLKKIPAVVVKLNNQNPEDYIISKSVFRRNLSQDQIICIAVDLFTGEDKNKNPFCKKNICKKFSIKEKIFNKFLELKTENPEIYELIKSGNIDYKTGVEIIKNTGKETYPVIGELEFLPDKLKIFLKKIPPSIQQELFLKIENSHFSRDKEMEFSPEQTQRKTEENAEILKIATDFAKEKEENIKNKKELISVKKEKSELEKKCNAYKYLSQELMKKQKEIFSCSSARSFVIADIMHRINELKSMLVNNTPTLKNVSVKKEVDRENMEVLLDLKRELIFYLGTFKDNHLAEFNEIFKKLDFLDSENAKLILELLEKIFIFLDLLFSNINRFSEHKNSSCNISQNHFSHFFILTRENS